MTTLIEDVTVIGGEDVTVIGGIDTHKHTHYAAVIDEHGRLLGHRQFPATSPGYEALRSWMRGYGDLASIGVESTGSFGAALARELTRQGEHVLEVNRPNRIARRMEGKSDRLDAEQIARAVLGETSTAIPKSKSGTIEVIRTLRVTRSSAVKARTQAFNALFGIMIGAPSTLRDELVDLTKMRRHQPTRAYVERRTAEGLSKREIIRCLKRYIAREIYAHLPQTST